ncbi:putative metal-dependent hydrolase [Paenibacillus sambharensis]|uniref:Putative metal-dependent hydrolase n=1 Tax=Paenibacillus sambharensis TaxID=1803190 RepID=A0A2W1LQT4_9BACL|nr:putative metal-dependent hydrolase [Paenibacillus sambharensis]PZD97312.1 putative metal-dependent hydrolase [Paenibacillus sambharensis]
MTVNPSYPIGPFQACENPDLDVIHTWISEIGKTPAMLREVVGQLNDAELDTPYRAGGWTVRQVVHHIADNNMNAYFRFKRALTEDCPHVSSYQQDKWAALADYMMPVDCSLSLIDAIYSRFVALLRTLDHEDFHRTMNSEAFGILRLDTAVQRFLWHDRHHLEQIRSRGSYGRG